MLNKLRPEANKITNQIGSKININPNIITITGFLISLFACVLYANNYIIPGAIFIIISGGFDMLDGAIARSQQRKSPFGGFLDSVCDRFSDGVIIIGILYSGYIDPILACLAIMGSFTVSYTRSRAENAGINCTVGIAERAERLLIIVIGSFISALTGSHLILYITIVILTVLSYITVLQRMYYTWANLEPKQVEEIFNEK
ncbi:MAG: archaetidylinositol phosphate synthase [Methanobacteriaceae archaeon]|nr:archaetidylinositol phosphate synthase [Methanobacteriaceae archaeon]